MACKGLNFLRKIQSLEAKVAYPKTGAYKMSIKELAVYRLHTYTTQAVHIRYMALSDSWAPTAHELCTRTSILQYF